MSEHEPIQEKTKHKQISKVRPLNELLDEIKVEKQCEIDNFDNKKTMKKYRDDDYRIKKYLHLITLG